MAAASGLRITVLFLLIAVLTLAGLLWFDYLGLINVKERFAPVLQRVGIMAPAPLEGETAADLLDRVRIEKLYGEIDRRQEELDKREESIAVKENELEQMVETLAEKEKALEDREKSFNEIVKQYENRNANLRQSALYYNGMPPEKAVERMLELEDQDLIDILRTAEQLAQEAGQTSIVAYWISLMPPERAAVVNRKMLKKPES
ncbi:MAG: flagellar protein FlbB [Spirochaetales bacterium]|nr:flagellar protein FlbB [Spirochaetales bacterium]